MKKAFLLAFVAISIFSCSENIDQRAARMARENTEKYCPGPFINGTREDSIAYEKLARTYTYYYTFAGEVETPEFIRSHQAELQQGLRSIIVNAIEMQPLIEAGIKFRFIVHSMQNPEKEIYRTEISF